jgi:hypothetical protein
LSVYSRSKLTLFSVLLCCWAVSAAAQDDFFSNIEIDSSTASDPDKDWSLIGRLEQKVAYGLESPPALFSRQKSTLTSIQTSLFTQLDWSPGESSQFRLSGQAFHDEIYRYQDDITFSAAEINEFRNRFEIRDFYVEHEFDNDVYIKLGNQMLAWGVTEYLRITDLVNTENQFSLGQEDLEDLRRQVPALLASVNLAQWNLDTVITHDAGRDDIAPAGDEFDQFAPLRAAGIAIHIEEADNQQEFFMRLSRTGSRGDVQLVAGEFNDNALSLGEFQPAPEGGQAMFGQSRMRALGIAGTRVAGNWLFFSELGLHKNKALRPGNDAYLLSSGGWQKKDLLLGALGIEYSGLRNLLLTLELDGQRIRDNDKARYGQAEKLGIGLRAYWTGLNERLQVLAVVNELADDAGRVSRFSVDYDWSDNFTLGFLWVNYAAPVTSYVNHFRYNDVIQARLQYNFQY